MDFVIQDIGRKFLDKDGDIWELDMLDTPHKRIVFSRMTAGEASHIVTDLEGRQDGRQFITLRLMPLNMKQNYECGNYFSDNKGSRWKCCEYNPVHDIYRMEHISGKKRCWFLPSGFPHLNDVSNGGIRLVARVTDKTETEEKGPTLIDITLGAGERPTFTPEEEHVLLHGDDSVAAEFPGLHSRDWNEGDYSVEHEENTTGPLDFDDEVAAPVEGELYKDNQGVLWRCSVVSGEQRRASWKRTTMSDIVRITDLRGVGIEEVNTAMYWKSAVPPNWKIVERATAAPKSFAVCFSQFQKAHDLEPGSSVKWREFCDWVAETWPEEYGHWKDSPMNFTMEQGGVTSEAVIGTIHPDEPIPDIGEPEGEKLNPLDFDDEAIDMLPDRRATGGPKYDADKSMVQLLPPQAVLAVGNVLRFGAQKYAPNSWHLVEEARTRYIGAGLRHIMAHIDGEVTDSESGLPHLAHGICSLMFVLELLIREQTGRNDDGSRNDGS